MGRQTFRPNPPEDGSIPAHVNAEQHRLTVEHIKSLTSDRDVQEMLSRVAQGSTPVFAHKTRSGHIQVRIQGDGITHVMGTPQDWRSVKNDEAWIRRNMRQIGHNFPKRREGSKKDK